MTKTKYLIMVVVGISVVFGLAVNNVHGEDSANGNLTGGNGSLDAEHIKNMGYNYFFGLYPTSHEVIAARGRLPELKTEEQKKNWSYTLKELGESLKAELPSSYMHPNGKVMTCGSNSRGYFVILFYENLTNGDPLIDEIYTMIYEKAKNMGIQDVPVEFGYGVYHQEYADLAYLTEPERKAIEEYMKSGRDLYKPEVIAVYGTLPEFETKEQWRNWVNVDQGATIEAVGDKIDSYFYPTGPLVAFGTNPDGYFEVTIYENSTVDKSLLDEIYEIIDEEAKKKDVHEVPVIFIKGSLIIAYDELAEDSNDDVPTPNEMSSESVPGFGLLSGLIALFSGWLFRRDGKPGLHIVYSSKDTKLPTKYAKIDNGQVRLPNQTSTEEIRDLEALVRGSTTPIELLVATDNKFYEDEDDWEATAQSIISEANNQFNRDDMDLHLFVVDYDESKRHNLSNDPDIKSKPLDTFKNHFPSSYLDGKSADLAIYLGGYDADGKTIGCSYAYPNGRHAWAQMVSDWLHGYDGSSHGRRTITIHELGHNFDADHEDVGGYNQAYRWWWGYYHRTVMWSRYTVIGSEYEFSSDDYHGDSTHDNARRISETKGIVANYT
jgi:hypothetical protein